jgi:hypothetical protein
MFLATMLVPITLRNNPFQIQVASIIMYTGFVFFFVFCDAGPGKNYSMKAKGTKGFSLGEKAAQSDEWLRETGSVMSQLDDTGENALDFAACKRNVRSNNCEARL